MEKTKTDRGERDQGERALMLDRLEKDTETRIQEIKTTMGQWKIEMTERDTHIQRLEDELQVSKQDVEQKNTELMRLKDELEKMRKEEAERESLLQQCIAYGNHRDEELNSLNHELENIKKEGAERQSELEQWRAYGFQRDEELKRATTEKINIYQQQQQIIDDGYKKYQQLQQELYKEKEQKKRDIDTSSGCIQGLKADNERLHKTYKKDKEEYQKTSKGVITELEQRFESTKLERDNLSKRCRDAEGNLEQYALEYDKLGKQCDYYNQKMNEHLQTIKKQNNEIVALGSDNKALVNANKALGNDKKELEKERSTLVLRLSKIADLAGITQATNNATSTDISDENRPTKLAEKLSELYENEWVDAFEEVCADLEEEKGIQYLLQLLQRAVNLCTDISNGHMESMKESVTTLKFTASEKIYTMAAPDGLSAEFLKQIKGMHRHIGQHMETLLLENITEAISTEFIIQYDKKPATCTYIRKCVQQCWSMSLNDPPVYMNIDPPDEHTKFDTDVYKAYTKTGKLLHYVVWPALYLHEGGPLLSKGVAQGEGGK